MTTSPLITADELLLMPDDGRRIELIRGRLVESPHRSMRHGELVASIAYLLAERIKDPKLGTVMAAVGIVVTRSPDAVLIADIAVRVGVDVPSVSPDHGYGETVPEIVVDVVDDWDKAEDLFDREMMCAGAGVSAFIAVWPDHRELTATSADGTTRRLRSTDELDLSATVPGLKIPVTDVLE